MSGKFSYSLRISLLVGVLILILVGCSSNNYSETSADQAKAAREKIQQAQGAPPGMTK